MIEARGAVEFLLASDEPAVRLRTLTDVLGRPPGSAELAAIPDGPMVRALLEGQRPDGGFGVHAYRKWTGAHWRLISLVDLGYPPGDPRVGRAAAHVLDWVASPRRTVTTVDGRVRRCASMEGNAVRVCTHLRLIEDPRAGRLAESLADWQWPDGGWNCDKRPGVTHSSFHETLWPAWGLAEYHLATGDRLALEAAQRAAEFLLRHHLFRSERTGQVIDRQFLKLRYPPYWHYNVLAALRFLSVLGKANDPRAREALDVIEGKQLPEGSWGAEGRYWRRVGATGQASEVVDWGRGGNEMITLHVLSTLRAAGRVRLFEPAISVPG
jgi:hypothetical protein